jgi:hypothetical protein
MDYVPSHKGAAFPFLRRERLELGGDTWPLGYANGDLIWLAPHRRR